MKTYKALTEEIKKISKQKAGKRNEPFKLTPHLEVYHKDCEGILNWFKAADFCKNLGEGWRLPTKEELNLLYLHKDKIGGFVEASYWSSTEASAYDAWRQNFINGNQFNDGKNGTSYYVRAVRSI